MSKYYINQAQKLQNQILELEHEIKLNDTALQATRKAKSEKYIIEALETKDKKLRKKHEKLTSKFYKYADDNLKISDLNKLNGRIEKEEPFDEGYY